MTTTIQSSPPEQQTQPFVLPRTGFSRLPTVLDLIPVSRSQWWDGVARGLYPPAIKIAPRVTVWSNSDLHRLIELLAERKDWRHVAGPDRPVPQRGHERSTAPANLRGWRQRRQAETAACVGAGP